MTNEKYRTIEFADSSYIAQYSKWCNQVLLLIAPFMSENDPETWAQSCFISDESIIGDFLCKFDETEVLKAISEKVGFTVESDMYVWEVAARLVEN